MIRRIDSRSRIPLRLAAVAGRDDLMPPAFEQAPEDLSRVVCIIGNQDADGFRSASPRTWSVRLLSQVPKSGVRAVSVHAIGIRDPTSEVLVRALPGRFAQARRGSGATDVRRQMSRLYSAMVRSEEKWPLWAVLRMLMRSHRSRSR